MTFNIFWLRINVKNSVLEMIVETLINLSYTNLIVMPKTRLNKSFVNSLAGSTGRQNAFVF